MAGLTNPGGGGHSGGQGVPSGGSGTNWNAIGAVAGVVSAFIAAAGIWMAIGNDSDAEGKGRVTPVPSSSTSAVPTGNTAPAGPVGGIESTSPAPNSDPMITLVPDSGPVGAEVTVGGTGFRPGEKVRIRFDRYFRVIMRDALVGDDGSFSVKVIIPDTFETDEISPGETEQIWATGLSSEREADMTFLLTE